MDVVDRQLLWVWRISSGNVCGGVAIIMVMVEQQLEWV